MVKHIVMWKLKEYACGNTKEKNAQIIKEKLESLKDKIPGILKIEVGIDFSKTENSADVVLRHLTCVFWNYRWQRDRFRAFEKPQGTAIFKG